MRLDKALVKKGFFESRHQAQNAIKKGRIEVSGEIITKPSHQIKPGEVIHVRKGSQYVSRAGWKLEAALQTFNIDVKGCTVLDIGASTGGFTDCALKHGAKKVYAVENGIEQLHHTLRDDERVVSMEQTNFLHTVPHNYEPFDYFTLDVSFTSSKPFLVHLKRMQETLHGIVLMKPQFETIARSKRGIVKDKREHRRVIEDYLAFLLEEGIGVAGMIPSPITGQSGNQEYLIYIGTPNATIDVTALLSQAFQT